MSETDLDTAIKLFNLVETFDEYKEGLLDILEKSTKVSDPHIARKRVMKVANAKKANLIDNNPEFKAIMEQREQIRKRRTEQNKTVNRATHLRGGTRPSTIAQTLSKVRKRFPDMDIPDGIPKLGDINGFVASTRHKAVDPEELERKSKEKLWCPICGQKNTSYNIVNSHPTCMTVDKDGKQCWHRLVPKDELKNYNRKYRRNWKKRGKR